MKKTKETSMFQIRNLTITHLKDLKELVKDLSLTVNQGDKVAIIGEEGMICRARSAFSGFMGQ